MFVGPALEKESVFRKTALCQLVRSKKSPDLEPDVLYAAVHNTRMVKDEICAGGADNNKSAWWMSK